MADKKCTALAVVGCCYGRLGTVSGRGSGAVVVRLTALIVQQVVGTHQAFRFPQSQWLQQNDSGAARLFDVSAFRAAADSPHLWVQ